MIAVLEPYEGHNLLDLSEVTSTDINRGDVVSLRAMGPVAGRDDALRVGVDAAPRHQRSSPENKRKAQEGHDSLPGSNSHQRQPKEEQDYTSAEVDHPQMRRRTSRFLRLIVNELATMGDYGS